MRKIKIAQIGVAHDHACVTFKSLTKQTDIFEVVGYCDPEKELEYEPYTGKTTLAGYEYRNDYRLNPEMYGDYPELTLEEVLNYPGLDAVTIETSETNLFKYAQMAADKGLHVHMDKPGGVGYADFEKLVNTFKGNGTVLHMGYMYRYNPEVRQVLSDIKAGKYGEIYSVECQMSTRHPDEKRAWMKRYPGGMMFFLGCHLIDLIYQIQGEPEEVIPMNCATGINGIPVGEDFGFAVLKYKNGVSFAKATSVEPGGFMRRQFVVCGSLGTVELRPLEAFANGKGGSALYTNTRDVDGDIFNWGNDGYKRASSYDRYDGMMRAFAEYVCGEKENPYTMDYELRLYKLLMKACGFKED